MNTDRNEYKMFSCAAGAQIIGVHLRSSVDDYILLPLFTFGQTNNFPALLGGEAA
jgi:hypothetical protein